MTQRIHRPTYSARLPQVRITEEQLEQLRRDALDAGYRKPDGSADLSRYIRAILFDDDRDAEPEAKATIWL